MNLSNNKMANGAFNPMIYLFFKVKRGHYMRLGAKGAKTEKQKTEFKQ